MQVNLDTKVETQPEMEAFDFSKCYEEHRTHLVSILGDLRNLIALAREIGDPDLIRQLEALEEELRETIDQWDEIFRKFMSKEEFEDVTVQTKGFEMKISRLDAECRRLHDLSEI